MNAPAPRPARRPVPVLTLVLAGFAGTGAVAPTVLAQKQQGELWRHTMSMEMQGMSMPGQTSEVCVPPGKPEAAATQAMDPSCRVYDAVSSGNKFSAKFECKGENPMSGSMEHVTVDAKTTRGTMRVNNDGETMTMRYESTRLGRTCEVPQAPPPVAAKPLPAVKDQCTIYAEQLAQDPGRIDELAMWYVGSAKQCSSPGQLKPYCAAVQTPAGFLELKKGEASVRSMLASGSLDAETKAHLGLPFEDSLRACKLGTGPEAVENLRTRLQPVAREQGAWTFLVLEGDEATQGWLRDTAKNQCSGRSFTSAREPRYAGLCNPYGLALLRGDLAMARELAGRSPEDSGDGSAAASASGSGPGSAPEQGTPPAEAEQPSATKELLKKGRGVLRGILGGG